MIVADISFMDVFWSMLWFFFLFIWIMILLNVITDLFRDHSLSGVSKALWVVALVAVPFAAVLVYLIARGPSMAKRTLDRQQEAQAQFDSYVQSVASPDGGAGPADQIAKAKDLLDQGVIELDEFAKIKEKALA